MDVQQQLADLQQQALMRQRVIVDSAQDSELIVDGHALVNFSSNNYLGLANDPRVVAALMQAAKTYGVGSVASTMVSGYQRPHYELEQSLAGLLGVARVLLFSNGYAANLGIQQSFLHGDSLVIHDKLNHASMIDGARMSTATLRRYPHGQIDRILSIAEQYPHKDILISSESVFSMQGDKADLHGLQRIAGQLSATLLIDDAHGLGVIGRNGLGVLHEQQVAAERVDLYMATLGKAIGCYGAFVAGSEDRIEYLLQKSRALIYTTAIPAALAAAALAAIDILRTEPWRVQRLQQLTSYFQSQAEELKLAVLPSTTAIQSLIVGDNQQVLRIAKRLKERGLLVQAIRPPTVPKHTARLRITLSAKHTQAQIDRLLAALCEFLNHE